MKKDKKEIVVNGVDISSIVNRIFSEHSWLMAKLAASSGDDKECFVDMAKTISHRKINEIYGDMVDDRIIERADKEIYEFNRINQLENIFKLSDMLHKMMNKGTLIIPRLTVGNSLLLFLFGISNVNPLPRHNYCPKCHTFHWGDKQAECCECCGEPLVEDGFDLDYQLLIDDIGRLKFPFNFSTSGKKVEEEGFYKLFDSKELKLAKLLEFKQTDFKQESNSINEIIKCFEETYYSSHYKKKHIVRHQAFIGIGELGNLKIQKEAFLKRTKTFDDLVRVVTMMHGTGVRDSSNRLCVEIYSRDDLFKELKKNQLSDDDSLIVCRETRLSGEGHLSSLSEAKLKQAGAEGNLIEFIRLIHYLFVKAHSVANLKVLLKLAKTYLEKPEKYYEAYFKLKKRMFDKMSKNADILKCLAESENTVEEENVLSFIDMLERNVRIQ